MNNQVEYEALIAGLKLAKDMGVRSLKAKSDSQLIISQVNGMYETKVPFLNKYLEKVRRLLESFDHFELERISQLENDRIDAFTKLANMKLSNENRSIIQLIMLIPSIERKKSMCVKGKMS